MERRSKMNECLFCKIAQKKVDSQVEYEDDEVVAFWDINPKAPFHLLIIPKKHITSVSQMSKDDTELVGKLIYTAKMLAEKKGIAREGYRLVFNNGRDSGQVVDHLHLHLLAGQAMGSMV